MKGLLIKDMRILMRQKTTLLVIVLLGIFMSMNGGNAGFSLGYMMIVSASLVASTISYDFFERGMSFMLTLPIRRRDYVLEKYLLALLVEVAVAGIAVLLQVVSSFLGQPAEWATFIGIGIGCLIAAMLIIAVYIPVYIKCGPEKSRIAMLIVVGIIALVTYLVYKVKPLQMMLEALVKTLSTMTAAQVAGIGVLVWALIMAASIGFSIGIVEKKEF